MNARTWNLLRPAPEDAGRLASELGISATLAAVLVNRGLVDLDRAQAFLNPDLARLHDPFLMRDMFEAVYAVVRAVRDRVPILVWGDYDVDGVTGTALLVDLLRRHTPHVRAFLPHRVEDGYGLSAAGIGRFAAQGVKLVITVDCGISDIEAVEAGNALGMTFVVTDHHEPPVRLPPAAAVLNPLRPGCPYPEKGLAGVGIAFKLAQALARLIGPGPRADGEDGALLGDLDLVALGTVADIAPLAGENRILVRHGLDVLGRTRRPGLRALMDVAGITSRPLRSSQISFGLGPRINAAGRIDSADLAVSLMLSEDPAEAASIASRLDGLNRRRQEIEAGILEEALAQIAAPPGMHQDRFLVLASPTWHPGVIGVVASKIAERFARPAILVSTGSDPGRGSARSIPQVNIYDDLVLCSGLFESFGGHAHAAGISIRPGRVDELRRKLNRGACDGSAGPGRPARLDIDAVLALGEVRSALAEELRRLAPFGHGNPEPTFAAIGVRLQRPPAIVGNNHLRLSLLQKPHARQFIGFGLGGFASDLTTGVGIDVAFDLDLEGRTYGTWERCRLRDVRFPGGDPTAC